MLPTDNNSEEKDINDVFEELLFCEELSQDTGHKEGFQKGAAEGNVEAYHLGYHRGAELGSEIGYYSGVLESLIVQGNFPDKYLKQVNSLKELIDNFPHDNDESVDILQNVETIRTNYKKICALLKLDAAYPEFANLSF